MSIFLLKRREKMEKSVFEQEKERYQKEIRKIIVRIKNSIKEYREKYYTPMPKEIKERIFDRLLSVNQTLSTYIFLQDMGSSEFYEIINRFEKTTIDNDLEQIVSLTKQYYNYDVADTVIEQLNKVIGTIHRKNLDLFMKYLPTREQIVELKKSINLSSIFYKIELPKEFESFLELFDPCSGLNKMNMYVLMGIKKVLLEFEKSLSFISKLEKQEDINILFEYFEVEIDFDDII